MAINTATQNSTVSSQALGFLRGAIGLGTGTSVIAYINGGYTALTPNEADTTVGDVFNNVYAQVSAGYHDFVVFIANMDVTTAGALGLAASAVLAKVYNRRITTTEPEKQYFECTNAASIPHTRIGYSDRMSYAMAELAQLAYIPAEDISHIFQPALVPIKKWMDKAPFDKAKKDEFTSLLNEVSLPSEHFKEELTAGLIKGSFNMVAPYLSNQTIDISKHQTPNTISKLSAQGFVCYHKNSDPEKSFIVVAFRGSESNVEDWLTNADAKPLIDQQIAEIDQKLAADKQKYGFAPSPTERFGRVHRGFYGAFLALAPQIMKNIHTAKQDIGLPTCPVYFTGHSLGGAMATITARELMPDSNGAVYNFGSPRVGDYNYFNGMKTPLFRVVNSSDIVPRVPPGIYAPIFKLPVYLVRWTFAIRQGLGSTAYPLLSKVLDNVEKFTDSLSHYRHYGDLRYLTDVVESKNVRAEILSNPSKFDQIFWFFSSIGASFGKPVKSHSMQIYRNKLKNIAAERNK